MKGLASDWNEFWFARTSARPLGLFRIALGVCVLAWCALLAPDLTTWYSNDGVFPTAATALRNETARGIGVLTHTGSPVAIFALFALTVVCAASFTAGYCTKASTVLLFLCVVSFNHRNSLILNSGDTLMRLDLFYMMFAPVGAALSVDRWLAERSGDADPSIMPTIEAWPVRLIQLQLSAVYACTFLWKMTGPLWLNGNAVYYPLQMSEFAHFPLPTWVTAPLAVNLFTYGTLVIELALSTLIWVRQLRKYVLLSGIALHLGIEYALNIPLFSFVIISTYIVFFEDRWVARIVDTVRRLRRKGLVADG